MVDFKTMDFSGVPMREGSLIDFPTAWRVQKEVGPTLVVVLSVLEFQTLSSTDPVLPPARHILLL